MTHNLLLKAKYSFISALIFFIVANPETYKFTRTMFGSIIDLTQSMGANGLLLHTVIFFFAMLGLMMVP
jgi:hypothetical protein